MKNKIFSIINAVMFIFAALNILNNLFLHIYTNRLHDFIQIFILIYLFIVSLYLQSKKH